MATIAFEAVSEDLVVFLGANTTWLDDDWLEYIRFLQPIAQHSRESQRALGILVFAEGTSEPNAKQRASLVETNRGVTTRTAVMTSATAARLIMTAFGWLGYPMSGFAPTDVAGAASYLRLTSAELERALKVAAAIAPRIGGSRNVEVAQHSLGYELPVQHS